MDYMTLKEASKIWGVTPRWINYYCSAGRIPGAEKWEPSGLSQRMLRSHWMGGENLPGNQEENIMIEVYYAEDDETIGKSVKEYLEQQNCKVAVFDRIADVKKALIGHLPTIVLLDWNMPDGQGSELCLWIRERWKTLPIVYLTIRGDSHDIVTGFQNGADDYVVKPFDLAVLYSRLLALLRRTKTVTDTKLFCDDLMLDKEKTAVYDGQKEIVVSQPEYRILLILMENKGKTITRNQLLEQVWDRSGNYVNDNTLTVTMKRLREKLNHPACLKTIRSFGYRMEDTQ